ncbi:MAG TPA: cupin domain-containing protein [Caulobacteraceae bacterium]|nr:cupin domain-containing protein [Caulobacteraceae bacterium]
MDLKSRASLQWRPVREGVTLAALNMTGGAGSFLMRYEPGSRSPTHTHPGGEEIYVVSGEGRLDDIAFGPGDHIFTPPGEGHTLHARTEVLIHVILPEPVLITE